MEIKLIDYGYITAPYRAHENDAGYDVFTRVDIEIPPHTTIPVPLGFGLEVPAGFMACVFPRSGFAAKGLLPQLPPVDAGYTGEVHAIVLNSTDEDVMLSKNTKIGQLVFMPIYHFTLATTESKQRGTAAFGSTGFTE